MRLLVLLLLLPKLLPAQSLLVNGGFQEINMCREYYMPCGPKGWFGVPIGVDYFMNSAGYDGKHYVGFYANHPDKPYKRSFLQTEIMCPLVKDSTYVVEMMVMGKCVNPGTIGIYLPSTDYLWDRRSYTQIQAAAAFTDASQLKPSNKKNWYRLSLPFKATGKERWLVIGNFSKDSATANCTDSRGYTVYYLDVVSLKQLHPSGISFQQCAEWSERQAALYTRRERHELLEDYVRRSRDSLGKPPVYTARPDPPALPPKPKSRIDTLVIPDVFFAVDDSRLNDRAENLLTGFARKLDPRKIDSLVVEGHTDSTGSVDHNEDLGMRRASSVAAYLESRLNVNASLFYVRGFASRRPVATNRTAKGRQANRRVEIYLYRKE